MQTALIQHMETTAHITASLSPGHRKQEPAGAGSQGDSHAVSKRLQSELMSLMASADPGVSAFPDGDSLFSWLGSIQGVQGTVYESLSYKLSLKFPSGAWQNPLARPHSLLHTVVTKIGKIAWV